MRRLELNDAAEAHALAKLEADLAEAQANARIAWGTLAEVKRNHEEELERLSIDHADTLVLINAQREKFERDADAAIARAEAAEAQAKGANTYAGQLADDAGRYMRELEAERAAHAATKAKLGQAVAALREHVEALDAKRACRRADPTLGAKVVQTETALRAILDPESTATVEAYKREREERDSLKAEIAMLRGVDCGVDGDGPCGVCIKCARNSVDWCDAKFNGQGDE